MIGGSVPFTLVLTFIVDQAEDFSGRFAQHKDGGAAPVRRVDGNLAVRHGINFKTVRPDWVELPQEVFSTGQQILAWDGESILLGLFLGDSQVGKGICQVSRGLP